MKLYRLKDSVTEDALYELGLERDIISEPLKHVGHTSDGNWKMEEHSGLQWRIKSEWLEEVGEGADLNAESAFTEWFTSADIGGGYSPSAIQTIKAAWIARGEYERGRK